MPVNDKYDGYDSNLKKSSKVRDFAGGDLAVKSKGEEYLPKLGGQTSREYEAYLMRGHVIPAVEPTNKAIIGSIMRKEPMIDLNAGLDYVEFNATGNDEGLDSLISGLIQELNYSGGSGYLIEFDNDLAKPIVKNYVKESVINISDDYIVLKQSYQIQDDKDKFKQHSKTEYLELTYDENGFYIQNLWRETKKGYEIVETLEPTIRGDRLDFLPFVFCGVGKLGAEAFIKSDPLLLHLANVNSDQYRLSTDQRHGLHWTALPTLFLFGELTDAEGKKKQIKVGAGSSNHIEDNEARVELLEFSGAGLGAIKQAIDDDIATMASIGAKMLTDTSGGVKSAETSRIESSGETATLSTIANTIDLCFNEVLRIMGFWLGIEDHGEFAANRDFIDIKLDPQALSALLQTWQSGGMSLHSFLTQLEKGELLPKGVDADAEMGRIETTGRDFA